VRAIAVELSGTQAADVCMPDVTIAFQVETCVFVLGGFIEKAELKARRGRRKDSEVDTLAVPMGAKRERLPGSQVRLHRSGDA
jgi:hypothetical protein